MIDLTSQTPYWEECHVVRGCVFTAFIFCRDPQDIFENSKFKSKEETLFPTHRKNGDRYPQIDPQPRPRRRSNNQKRALGLNPARPSRNPLHHPRRHRGNPRCRHKSANREYLTPFPYPTIAKTSEC